jgi:YbbR domain-containing protein
MTPPTTNKETIQQKTRTFFHSQKWKDLLVFFLFVAIAAIFWLMQYLQQTSNHENPNPTQSPHTETTTPSDTLHTTSKELPIHISGTLTPDTGYRLIDSLHIEPAKLWIHGSKDILDTLQQIHTQPINKKNIRNDLQLTVKLQIPIGTTTPTQRAKITAKLEQYAEKKFELPITCRNTPPDTHVRFFPSTAEITCYISLSHYPTLQAEQLEIGTDYTELLQSTDNNHQPTLLRHPPWLTDYRIHPEQIEYIIEQTTHQ